MSPQPSNRSVLLEGTLRAVTRLPLDQVTARVIAQESGANLASINYHFGSKEELISAAVVEGLDRWLREIAERLEGLPPEHAPAERFRRATDIVEATRAEHAGLARAFVAALARGHHDPVVAARLTEGFLHTRPRMAELLGLGSDETAADAGGLMHAIFTGLLVQSLLDESLALDGARVLAALHRVATVLLAGKDE